MLTDKEIELLSAKYYFADGTTMRLRDWETQTTFYNADGEVVDPPNLDLTIATLTKAWSK